jgi:hypothetical protein
MAEAKQRLKIRRRARAAEIGCLRRAGDPHVGDTFIFTERMVVDCILDGDVWLKHLKADGTTEHLCRPLARWRQMIRKTIKNGAVFRPV